MSPDRGSQGKKLRTLVVDDERLARDKLLALLAGADDFVVIGEASDAEAAVMAVEALRPDVLFLDVQLSGEDGFHVLRRLGATKLHVVFLTAYDPSAVEAFTLAGAEYLLKPFDRDRFAKTLQRVRERVHAGAPARYDELLARVGQAPQWLERVPVKAGGETTFLPVGDIEWIEAADNYVRLHAGSEGHLIRETISSLAGRLDPQRFARVHRSAIVNLDAIREVQPLFHGNYRVVMHSGAMVPVGRRYRDVLLKR